MKRAFCLVSISLSLISWVQGQGLNYIIDFISTKDGLSHNYVSSILSDDLNVKWIGTENGITKYNGIDFEQIKPSEEFQALLNENIEVLFMDRDFNLWIGTKSGGLTFLDIKNNVGKNVNHLIDLSQEGDMRITALSQDHLGNIWVGTWSKGVFVISPQDDKLLTHYPFNRAVYSISKDFQDNMWFCSGNRLNKYNPKKDETLCLYHTREQVTDILADPKRNRVWFALSSTDNNLYFYDVTTQKIDSIPTNIRSNFSRKLSLDPYNRLWVGTWGKGVYRSNEDLSSFDRIELTSSGAESMSGNYDVILDIHHDKNNVIWLATANGGLIKLLEGNGFQNIDRLIRHPKLRRHLNCTAIFRSQQQVYLATFQGLYHGTSHEQLEQFEEIGDVKINALYEHEGKLYVGTAKGFHVINLGTNKLEFHSGAWRSKVTSFLIEEQKLFIGTQQLGLAIVPLDALHQPSAYEWYSEALQGRHKIESNRITEIKKDQAGHIWMSTYNGLHLYTPADSTFIHQGQLLDTKLPSVIVNSMLLKDGFIWLASPNGLIKLSFEDQRLHTEYIITRKDGLNSDFICAVTFDQDDHLWLSTHTEIVRFLEKDQTVISYGEINGIRTTSFNNKSSYIDNQGNIYFGGVDNVTFYNPKTLKDFNAVPEVVFTNLRVNNELIRYKPGHTILKQNVHYADQIELTHEQAFFSIRFVANDFLGNLNVTYRYLLEGYQTEWIDLQHRNEINFTGLPAGNYTLKVQASRDGQHWSPVKSIDIKLLSSPWVSPIALILYGAIAFSIAFYLIRSNNDRMRLKNSLEIARIDKEKEVELAEAKLTFFTNISHEFRTPLTLIISPLKELLEDEKLSPKTYKSLRYIDRNTDRLLNLTNQLLDFRKAEQNLLELNLSMDYFNRFAKEVYLYFQEAARSKQIQYEFVSSSQDVAFAFDRDKMEIVLSNLLSNAIKYTPEGGKISMQIDSQEQVCHITLQDSGIGMPAADVENIFDRFYQIKSSNTAHLIGSGIGLAFSKEIIALHGGSIEVSSELDQGTEFRVMLPIKQANTDTPWQEAEMVSAYLPTQAEEKQVPPLRSSNGRDSDPTILIIDDNPEILAFLHDVLSEQYRVIQAVNGNEGFHMASTEIPDLIISDVMMPEKDGITLCKELKGQLITSHIPIILLTAKTATVYEIEGLETGADDYVTKPFNVKIIKAKIKNIFDNKAKLRAHLLNKVRFEPTAVAPASHLNTEDIFIDTAIALVEQHLDDPAFGIDTMVEELHMSQSTLYRKIKSLTGLSLTAFIRSIRLKKSAQLILSTDLNLNQIAYEVGFNDYKYFKTSFKKQFDCVPSKYREQMKS